MPSTSVTPVEEKKQPIKEADRYVLMDEISESDQKKDRSSGYRDHTTLLSARKKEKTALIHHEPTTLFTARKKDKIHHDDAAFLRSDTGLTTRPTCPTSRLKSKSNVTRSPIDFTKSRSAFKMGQSEMEALNATISFFSILKSNRKPVGSVYENVDQASIIIGKKAAAVAAKNDPTPIIFQDQVPSLAPMPSVAQVTKYSKHKPKEKPSKSRRPSAEELRSSRRKPPTSHRRRVESIHEDRDRYQGSRRHHRDQRDDSYDHPGGYRRHHRDQRDDSYDHPGGYRRHHRDGDQCEDDSYEDRRKRKVTKRRCRTFVIVVAAIAVASAIGITIYFITQKKADDSTTNSNTTTSS